MKKKRHKEKLFALGMVPPSRALEFTYKQSGDEAGEQKLEEVLEFLQNTHEIYLTDRTCYHKSLILDFHSTVYISILLLNPLIHAGSQAEIGPQFSLSLVESLFSHLSGETLPPAEISRLCGLRGLLVKGEEQLISKLQEFRDTSTLPAGKCHCMNNAYVNILQACLFGFSGCKMSFSHTRFSLCISF